MDDLTTGGPPEILKMWKRGGVWIGYYKATKQDMAEYTAAFDSDQFDEGSLVGRYDRSYRVGGEPSPMGGEGSDTYEYQNVAPGVIFAPEEDGKWWVYGDKDSPRRNRSREALHKVFPDPDDESYWDMYIGADPKSLAGLVEKFGGDFVWLPDEARYHMIDADGMRIEYRRM